MLKKTEAVRLNRVIPRVEASPETGLTGAQVKDRLENGYANAKPISATKTFGQIVKTNLFTYFNLIFALLALCVILVGSYNNLTFMPIIITNIIIGIVQELRSRRALSKITFVSAQTATVIRAGKKMTISAEETVLDDIVIFNTGNQIYADAIVVSGECSVNEALVTGEADEITKTPGDTLLSGSFIVTGEVYARLERVGSESFVSQLTLAAKKDSRKQSGMVAMLQRLVQIIGILIIPIGIAMFIQQMRLDISLQQAVVGTVAALVGMIPEGLYLLVSVALTVSVMRLANKRTLVNDMKCVESLARVDVLCVDKTGTITENRMDVSGVVLVNNNYPEDKVNHLLSDYVDNMAADNETMVALKKHFPAGTHRVAIDVMPFSSSHKYSAVSFQNGESYFLGAPERILQSGYERYRGVIEQYSSQGYRVLLLALYRGDIYSKINPSAITPIALVTLSNLVREAAPKTFNFFKKQKVKIVVISGDNPVTVAHVAHQAGIDGAERYIDAAELKTDKQIKRAVDEYIVFGRVTPDQKRKLVMAFKSKGHTVAMTGDGVNDVLALKNADCSIAMASGSEVASQISDIVLLDSDFSAMPSVVNEGRRVINNIERSASLFLVRNIFSFLLAIVATIILGEKFPLSPSQLSLIGGLLIGLPSFVLALEPNTNLVRGKFLVNILRNALPAGLTIFLVLLILILIAPGINLGIQVPLDMSSYELEEFASVYGIQIDPLLPPTVNELYDMIKSQVTSVIATFVIAFVGFLMLYKICHPPRKRHIVLMIFIFVGFAGGAILFGNIFGIYPIPFRSVIFTVLFCLASAPIMFVLSLICSDKKKGKRMQ